MRIDYKQYTSEIVSTPIFRLLWWRRKPVLEETE
jgi:hypothetical protein